MNRQQQVAGLASGKKQAKVVKVKPWKVRRCRVRLELREDGRWWALTDEEGSAGVLATEFTVNLWLDLVAVREEIRNLEFAISNLELEVLK